MGAPIEVNLNEYAVEEVKEEVVEETNNDNENGGQE